MPPTTFGPELPSITCSDAALRPVIAVIRLGAQHFHLPKVGRADSPDVRSAIEGLYFRGIVRNDGGLFEQSADGLVA